MSDLTTPLPKDLRSWLVGRVAAYLRKSEDTIKADVPLAEYGLDSLYALNLVGDLEDHLEIEIDATFIWDHPTIDKLAVAIEELVRAA